MSVQLVVGLVLIAICLAAAVVRPFGLSEAVVAVPCAALALITGASHLSTAEHSVRELGPTVAFLAAILAFGRLCAAAGVFDYLGSVTAHASHGVPKRLLVLVVGFAAVVTATLTLDATVVLVTPVVLATARRLHVPNRPHSYACAHIANSGSLLLPVSNLTNLLAFTASGLSFGRFAAAMTLPWLLACALDWAALRLAFRRDLTSTAAEVPPVLAAPRYALAVLALTVAGFVLTTAVGLAPAWAALAGCVALAVPQLPARKGRGVPRTHPPLTVPEMVLGASPGFCAFVLCLGVLVAGVLSNGIQAGLSHLIPSGTGLAALLGLALLAAVLANLVNNLPTTLALLPLVTGSPLAVLAVLVGVNLGPNATYPGSLATLLWRRSLPPPDRPRAVEFHRLGLISTPVLVCTVTVALWLVAGPLRLR
ncbi:SLC13 family permease [Jatrophihabitans lederbergiae]|uniref:ArsB/NhaD family transporter n=1 Tax=Jatrophihabitans lederbergiae TaxID=3075547 RepID=A0ABU2J8Z2_9ACTN|nr:SLC13 family permease [Jatrophihabitans sp. DSM 44399]MDT0261422.1 ArsB/NhaD family transporter [Jatrophihabitans sp. DSM 44399]